MQDLLSHLQEPVCGGKKSLNCQNLKNRFLLYVDLATTLHLIIKIMRVSVEVRQFSGLKMEESVDCVEMHTMESENMSMEVGLLK